jgi:hypothetical protein
VLPEKKEMTEATVNFAQLADVRVLEMSTLIVPVRVVPDRDNVKSALPRLPPVLVNVRVSPFNATCEESA